MPPAASGDPISVVMPVRNALPYLDAAIRSILDQTHANFELVVLDDASTDGSSERLRHWAAEDQRIRLFKVEQNLGPVGSSNRVVSYTAGSIIARMDADDISEPERLRRQLKLLTERPDVGLAGTLYEIIDAEGQRVRGPDIWRLRPGSVSPPFPHGSIMFRRELFDRIGGYRPECEFWEDQDFALRASATTEVVVLPELLYRHRQSPISTRIASDAERVERAVDLMYRCVRELRSAGSYEHLLGRNGESGRVDPRVFISLGSLILWSKGRPKLFRRLLERGNLQPNFRSAAALAWTIWADLSPSSLRSVLGALVKIRNRTASPRVLLEGAIPWTPFAGSPKP